MLKDKLFAKSNSATPIDKPTSETSQIKLEKEEEFTIKAVNMELQERLHSCKAKELNTVPYKAERRFRSSHESTCPEPAFDL